MNYGNPGALGGSPSQHRENNQAANYGSNVSGQNLLTSSGLSH